MAPYFIGDNMSEDGNPEKIRQVLSMIAFKVIADYGYTLAKSLIQKIIRKLKKKK